LEILVVITIMGILAGLVVNVSVRGAARARDAKRVRELYQISHAIQQYYANNKVLPDGNYDDASFGCEAGWDGGNENYSGDDFIPELSQKGILGAIPKESLEGTINGIACTFRYSKQVDPCGCSGTYGILYAACETGNCPVGERPDCCEGLYPENGGEDEKDIAIFIKEEL